MRCTWLLSLVASACVPADPLALPGGLGAVGAVAFVELPSLGAPDRTRFDLYEGAPAAVVRSTDPAFGVDPRSARYVMLFDESPAELGLDPRLYAHDPGARGRLRRPARMLSRDDVESTQWLDAPGLLGEPALTGFRLPAAECVGGAGCYDGLCRTDCGPDPVIDAPAAPSAPVLTPCAADLVEAPVDLAALGALSACAAAVPPVPCGADARETAGGRCAPLAEDCAVAAGGFPPVPPGALRARWVHAAAGDGGDGSAARPWRLAEALARSSSGDTLLLSTGEHVGWTDSGTRTLSLVGVCPALTSLVVDALSVRDATVALDRVHLTGRSLGARGGAVLSIQRARVDAAAIAVEVGAALRLREVVTVGDAITVEGVLDASAVALGGELRAAGGRVSVADARVESARSDRGGVLSLSGTRVWARAGEWALHVTYATLIGRDLLLDVGTSTAVQMLAGSSAELERVVVRGPHLGGVEVRGDGAALVLRDALFVGPTNYPLWVRGRASLRAERVTIVDATQEGLVSNGDTEVLDLRVSRAGRGVRLRGGRMALSRVRVDGVSEHAVRVRPDATSGHTALVLEDVTLENAGERCVDMRNEGGSSIDVRAARLWMRGCRGAGLDWPSADAQVSLTDLVVRGVSREALAMPCSASGERCAGVGVVVSNTPGGAGSGHLERFAIDGVSVGFEVQPGARLEASDGVVDAGAVGLSYGGAGDWRDEFRRVRLRAPEPVR